MVSPDSNIAGFQRRFQIVSNAPSDAILRFVFRWDARRETLGDFTPENRFQAAVKAAAEAGAVFYEATGRLMH